MRGLRIGTGIALAALAAACGGVTSSSTSTPAKTTPVSTNAVARTKVANPFTIVDRYSASSLGLHNPRDLAIGPSGNLYVTDATDRVTVISPAGEVVRRWGGRGKGPGEFAFVTSDPRDPTFLAASIAVAPNGDVYVSDSGNARVEVFSPTGSFVREFRNSTHLFTPSDLVVGPRGDVYVNDLEQGAVEKYSPAGAFEWQGQSGPFGSAIDHHGLVLTANDVNEAVTYLNSRGDAVDTVDTTSYLPSGVGPCDVSLDAQGDVYVQSCPGLYSVGEPSSPPVQYALVFDPAHNLIAAWYHAPFARSPRFGPNGEAFALGYLHGGNCFRCPPTAILKLKVALRGA